MSLIQLKQEAAELPPQERAELASFLDSLKQDPWDQLAKLANNPVDMGEPADAENHDSVIYGIAEVH